MTPAEHARTLLHTQFSWDDHPATRARAIELATRIIERTERLLGCRVEGVSPQGEGGPIPSTGRPPGVPPVGRCPSSVSRPDPAWRASPQTSARRVPDVKQTASPCGVVAQATPSGN